MRSQHFKSTSGVNSRLAHLSNSPWKQEQRSRGHKSAPLQPVITFNDPTAETGKAIFLNPSAACNFCHFNAGASMSTTQVKTEPLGDPPLPFPGRNENNSQLVDVLTDTSFLIPSTGDTVTGGLDSVTPVTIGKDPETEILSATSMAGSYRYSTSSQS